LEKLTVAAMTPLDWLEVSEAPRTRRAYGAFARQATDGFGVAIRTADGELAAIVGLYPDGERVEAWFSPGPACRRRMLAVIRTMRQLLDGFAVQAAPRSVPVIAYIHPRSVAGARIAASLGFEAVGLTDSVLGPLQTFCRRGR
jgi:hypothetical protein